MNPKEELTKLLIDSYDKGVEDAKQEAIIALEKTVAVMVAAERESIAQMFEDAPALVQFAQNDQGGCLVCGFTPKLVIEAVRARGTT